MKKGLVLAGIFALASCSETVIEKPKDLIPTAQMEDILYDLVLLEAVRSHQPATYDRAKNATSYVYDKYQVDSLQFVNSNAYYTKDLATYRQMYERITQRLAEQIKEQEAQLEQEKPTPKKPKVKKPLGDEPRIE